MKGTAVDVRMLGKEGHGAQMPSGPREMVSGRVEGCLALMRVWKGH